MTCEEKYFELYGRAPDAVTFCPYRTCFLGAHIDHQAGSINANAIDMGIHIAYSRKESGICEINSLNFPKRVQFHVNEIPDEKPDDWGDHLRGAVKQLGEKYPLRYGISAVISGDFPVGGLSSSAAVIIAFMTAIADVNKIQLDPWSTIMMAKAAENKYVGVNCGKLDQCAEVLSKKDQLLYLDCQDDSYKLIPWTGKPFVIGVFFSGLERSLANSAYNLRQDECKAAAYDLLALAGLPYGKFSEAVLRDVPRPVFDEYMDRLPIPFRKRAEHFFTEFERAQKGVDLWQKGDLEGYGQLVFESGASSINNYESGCPELITMYNIMRETDGIYGGRFSGAGFKGSSVAIIDPEKAEDVLHTIEEKYLKAYPALEGKYIGRICHSADGVDLSGGVRR